MILRGSDSPALEPPAGQQGPKLHALGRARFDRSYRAVEAFFTAQADVVPAACWAMARRFHGGGRLLAWGAGAAASDAWHVAVEFVHPVIVGKRALPALVLEEEPAVRLSLLGRPTDIALAISPEGDDPHGAALLSQARRQGLLTIALNGRGAGDAGADYRFAIEDDDPTVVQEVQETLYHVLWELVHVFLEQPGLLEEPGEGRSVSHGLESLLYPFLGSEPADPAPVLADVRASTLRKAADVVALRAALWERHASDLAAAARLLSAAFLAGRKVLAFGNGGSATDAQDLVSDLVAPPVAGWRPLPALDLTRDTAVLTAIGNDVGFENVFSRQVIALGEPGDVAVGFSTSGESASVLAGLERARVRGLRTLGFSGSGGGRMAAAGLDLCIVAPSSYVPRIQEAHATACHTILYLLHALLDA
ncbi:MAG TPA: SIS domain-containing protein [Thermoanaerobaculia bacterium]|nr:SIS domain-containing protein [Thermoanaerobaculia bacterium]